MHRLNISYKQFYVILNEIWLFESDPNAPSTWSERGGKQWQRSIRGRRNWDVELGPCAVIRHLCSVAFVWETKRPQADNSWSLIDRQVSCWISPMRLVIWDAIALIMIRGATIYSNIRRSCQINAAIRIRYSPGRVPNINEYTCAVNSTTLLTYADTHFHAVFSL